MRIMNTAFALPLSATLMTTSKDIRKKLEKLTAELLGNRAVDTFDPIALFANCRLQVPRTQANAFVNGSHVR